MLTAAPTYDYIVKAYSAGFYRCELWDSHISYNCFENLCAAWRCEIRPVWRLPNTTHSSLLPELCKTYPLLDLLYIRILKFVCRYLNSQSSLVTFIVQHSILFSRRNSTTGRNVLRCSRRCITPAYTTLAFTTLIVLLVMYLKTFVI